MFRTKWNSISLPEEPLPLIKKKKKRKNFKFEKYESAISGTSSSDSLANVENTFSWVSMGLLKKPAKKVESCSKQDKFY